MVNAGAIATTSLVPGATADAKWQFIHDGLSRFAGRKLPLNEEVYASASRDQLPQPEHRPAAAELRPDLLRSGEATDLYTRQCSLNVSAKDLAVMGATLGRRRRQPAHQGAGGRRGRLPLRARRDDDRRACTRPRATGSTTSGCRARAGSAAASSTVSPGKGGLGTFAPPLDAAGNSVKGQLVAKFLSQRLGMDLFVSQPED